MGIYRRYSLLFKICLMLSVFQTCKKTFNFQSSDVNVIVIQPGAEHCISTARGERPFFI
jgi:hypothetical protein